MGLSIAARTCVPISWQVLWLFGDEHYVTEVGAMNIFFLIEKEGGEGIELVTSPLEAGDILDGGRMLYDRKLAIDHLSYSTKHVTLVQSMMYTICAAQARETPAGVGGVIAFPYRRHATIGAGAGERVANLGRRSEARGF